MRLIDADKLKLQLSKAGTVHGPVLQTVNEISEIIDAQPAVENESEKLKEIINRINQVSENSPIYPEKDDYYNFVHDVNAILDDCEEFLNVKRSI